MKIVAALAALMVAVATGAAAETYPNRIVKLIVPMPPGGPVDLMGRLIAQYLSGALGQQVIVDNRPGASGTLAGRTAATAEPDGYTLLLGSPANLAIGPAMYGNIGYDPVKSFAPIALVSDIPYVAIARPGAPFDTVPQLVAYARKNPGTLNFGVPNGAPPHLMTLAFEAQTATDFVVVPYKGASAAITDMIGGQIDGGFETTAMILPYLRAHNVKALAVVSERRLPDLPDTATMIESGVPDLKGSSWTGVLAPAGTPQPIIDKLNAEITAGLKSRELVEKYAKLGAATREMTPQQFGAFVAEENHRLGVIVRTAGVKGD